MKKLIITTALILFTSVLAFAQTRTGKYVRTETERYNKNGIHTSRTIKFINGTIDISANTIKVDTASYNIIKSGRLQPEDEGMFSKTLLVVTPTKTGYKVLDCVLLLSKDAKTILEVIFHKTKSTHISYVF